MGQRETRGDAATAGLLASLGLPADATRADIEATHARLTEFLETAPDELRVWATQQLAVVDAVLRALPEGEGPLADADAANEADADAADEADAAAAADDDADDDDDAPTAKPAAAKTAPTKAEDGSKSGWKRFAPLAVAAAIVGIVVGVYFMGDQPAQQPSAAATPQMGQMGMPTAAGIDEKRAAELKKKVEANPADYASMRELGKMYFNAGDMAEAASWQSKILAATPNDLDARLALGVAKFNMNDLPGAEKEWLKAVEIDPTKPQGHYNLGFLYLSKSPPDQAKVDYHWGKVVELAPDSDLAKTVSSHLGALQTPAATPKK